MIPSWGEHQHSRDGADRPRARVGRPAGSRPASAGLPAQWSEHGRPMIGTDHPAPGERVSRSGARATCPPVVRAEAVIDLTAIAANTRLLLNRMRRGQPARRADGGGQGRRLRARRGAVGARGAGRRRRLPRRRHPAGGARAPCGGHRRAGAGLAVAGRRGHRARAGRRRGAGGLQPRSPGRRARRRVGRTAAADPREDRHRPRPQRGRPARLGAVLDAVAAADAVRPGRRSRA